MQNRDKVFTFAPLYYGKVGGLLAQLVEQWIENPCVPGSIPGETTKKQSVQFTERFFCEVISDKTMLDISKIF